MTQSNQPGERPQNWHFTWGSSQTLPDGADAYNHYTIIHGTWEVARGQMFARFGQAWSFDYDEASGARVARDYNMTYVEAARFPFRFEADGVTPLEQPLDQARVLADAAEPADEAIVPDQPPQVAVDLMAALKASFKRDHTDEVVVPALDPARVLADAAKPHVQDAIHAKLAERAAGIPPNAAYGIDRNSHRWDLYSVGMWVRGNENITANDFAASADLISNLGPIEWFGADNTRVGTSGGDPR